MMEALADWYMALVHNFKYKINYGCFHVKALE